MLHGFYSTASIEEVERNCREHKSQVELEKRELQEVRVYVYICVYVYMSTVCMCICACICVPYFLEYEPRHLFPSQYLRLGL